MMTDKVSATTKELREFGLLFGVILVLLFGLLLPWIFAKPFPLWPWWVLAVTATLAVLYPSGLKPFYKLWMLFGGIMGWINTRLILGIVFYLIFVPFGLVMKLFGKDPLSRKLDSKMTTYRVTNKSHNKENMENPF